MMTDENENYKKTVNEKISEVLEVENDLDLGQSVFTDDDKVENVRERAEARLQQLPATIDQNEVADTFQFQDDFEDTRAVLKDLTEQGQAAIAHYVRIAEMSESPRAFEVLATLLKTVGDLSKDSIDLHNKKQDYKEKAMGGKNKVGKGGMHIDQANIIVGTTADLQKQLDSPSEE